jgi:Zn-dependent protease with chaperone function
MCENDDQLGSILAHEIAHCVLGHGAELLSHGQFLDLMLVSIIVAIWSTFPTDITAALAHFLMTKLTNLTIDLPYSRTLETEADEVGLQIAAKACLDVREAVAFWQKMDLNEKVNLRHVTGQVTIPDHIDYLSTHPKHEKRADHLNSFIPEAIKQREQCNCWRLSGLDPRDRMKRRAAEFERLNDLQKNVARLRV